MAYNITVSPDFQVQVTVAAFAKTEIDAQVAAAQTAATGAADSEAQALAYRNTAEDHKDSALIHRNAAETASANALSAVTYQNLSGAETALAVNAVAFWKGVLPPMPAEDIPTSILVVAEVSQVTVHSLDTGTPVSWKVGDLTGLTITDVEVSGTKLWIGTTTGLVERDLTGNLDASAVDYSTSTTPALINNAVNAIATYTAPTSRLNEAGQPISVVPVGTDGGLSVILEDETVNDSASTTAVVDVLAHEQGVHWSTATGLFYATWAAIRAGDGFGDQIGSTTAGAQDIDLLVVPEKIEGDSGQITIFGQTASGSAVAGVMDLWPNYQSAANSISKLRTTDFATPLQLGSPALTALCEADDTDLVGATPLDDDFDGYADTAALTAVWNNPTDGRSSISWEAGKLRITNDTSGNGYAFLTVSGLVVGKRYAIRWNVSAPGTLYSTRVFLGNAEGTTSGGSASTGGGVTGDQVFYFTAVATSRVFHLQLFTSAVGPTVQMDFDNVRIDLATPDRSVNGNGLIVNTGLDVNPVFPGAKTMAYSGFTASNYLEQPYNADLDFGTGDFFIATWFKTSDAAGVIFDRNDTAASGNNLGLRISGSKLSFRATTGLSSTSDVTTDNWIFGVGCRDDGVMKVYIDGQLEAQNVNALDVTNTDAISRIGLTTDGATALNPGSLSLLTISAGAPTPEQIRVKYLAERPRFYGGAVDPTLPENALDMSLDPVTGLLWMIGATKQWAMDGDGILAASTLADKADLAHDRITVFDGEVSTWEDAA